MSLTSSTTFRRTATEMLTYPSCLTDSLAAKRSATCNNRGGRRGAGFRLRGTLTHQVFRKVLALTPSARAAFSSGRIFSHVTSDAETIYQLSTSGLGLMSSPLRIIGASRTPPPPPASTAATKRQRHSPHACTSRRFDGQQVALSFGSVRNLTDMFVIHSLSD